MHTRSLFYWFAVLLFCTQLHDSAVLNEQSWSTRLSRASLAVVGSSSQGSLSYPSSVTLPGKQVCRSETSEVVLVSDCRGFGLSLDAQTADSRSQGAPASPYVSAIEPKSVAERSV